jgi:energy-coupling factor transporter ATP-binding protein EcfA2
MKKKRIIIVGKGGSGKDHLRKILEKIIIKAKALNIA